MIATPQRLRVAIVLSELRPGGMERVVVHLARGLAAKGITAMVICLQNAGELASELDGTGVQLEALRSLSGKDFKALRHLRRLLCRFRPSVVNVHDYASTPYIVTANWLATRVPILFTAHGLLYEGFDRLRRRYRFFSRFFSSAAAVSAEVAQRHRQYLCWKDPVATIRNGVPGIERDPGLRRTAREEIGCGDQDILFLAVGNPRPEKAFEDLIDAAALLTERESQNQDFVVAIAGKLNDSDYCSMLLNRVKDEGLKEKIRFLGFRNDMTALYSAADVFVLSSRSEGLPMVILEAMMAGLPVVATKVGGVPRAVGENGLLVEPGHPAQLAEAMKRILSEDGLRIELGRAGQAHCRATYGVERMVNDYLSWYKKIVESA